MSSSSSVFTCKVDSDCHGNGYCTNEFDQELERVVGKCMCLDQYKYAPDCSEYAGKYNNITGSSTGYFMSKGIFTPLREYFDLSKVLKIISLLPMH